MLIEPGQGFGAVIFDLDGLLVDSEPLWHRAEIEVFGRYGVELTVDMCRSTKGRFVGEVTQHWYDQIGWLGPSPAVVAGEIVDKMEQLLATEVAMKPGVPDIMQWCRRRGLATAVASSSSRRLIAAALGRHQLQQWFDAICSVDDVGVGKPDPAVFLFAAGALGVVPDRCLVLEDAPVGAAAAVAAGMACVLVPEQRAVSTSTCGSIEGEMARTIVNGGGIIEAGGVDGVLASLADLPGAWDDVARRAAERKRRPQCFRPT